MAELWDAYDCNFNKIDNVTLMREGNDPKSAIPDGMYHLVSEIIVKHTDGTYLLMRRDFRKKYGGAWELTAGGSVLKGENAYEGAVRELAEETGINSNELQEIGRVISDIHHSAYVIYLCITDCDKNSIILQDGETIDYRWIDRDSMLEMSEDELISYRQIKLIENVICKQLCLEKKKTMNIKLVKLNKEYKNQLIEMMDEWSNANEKIVPYAIRKNDYHNFDEYLANLEIPENDRGLVPDSTYFCLDLDRDIFVGAVNIRHYLNETLMINGGHIGDGIRPSERRKGYATAMIGLALEECKKLGIDRVLMVCDKDNIGSAKSIVNNGGQLENEIIVDGIVEQRYWICDKRATDEVGKGKI